MKTFVCMLVVAISCCFSTAAANCMDTCASTCRQSNYNDMACLQNAVERNGLQTVNTFTNFLYSYYMAKVSRNNAQVAQVADSINRIKSETGCPLESILELDKTVNRVINIEDLDDRLQFLLRAVTDITDSVNHDMSVNRDMSLTTPSGGPAAPLIKIISNYLTFLGLPSMDGPTTGINAVKSMLARMASSNPGLMSKLVTEQLGSNALVGRLLEEVLKLVNNLLTSVTDTVGGVGRATNGLTGSVTGPTEGLVNSLGRMTGAPGLGSTVGDVTGMATGLPGRMTDSSGLGSANGGTKGLAGGSGALGPVNSITDALGSTSGIASGLLNSVFPAVRGVLKGPANIVNGIFPIVTDLVSGVPGIVGSTASRLLGGRGGLLVGILGGQGGMLGGLSGQGGGVGDLLNSGMGATGSLGGAGSLTGMGTGMLDSTLGGSTLGAKGSLQGAATLGGSGSLTGMGLGMLGSTLGGSTLEGSSLGAEGSVQGAATLGGMSAGLSADGRIFTQPDMTMAGGSTSQFGGTNGRNGNFIKK